MSQRTVKHTKSENLDFEFKKILCVIREHIPYINSNAYLMQCRIWLEKLSSPNVNKVLRNLYLVELCAQIQKNKLLPPFNEAPPSGSLKSLTKMLINRKSCRMLFQSWEHRKSKLLNMQNNARTNQEKNVDNCSDQSKYSCPNNTETWESEELLKSEKEASNVGIPIQKIKHIKHIPVRIGKQKKSTTKFDFQDIHKIQSHIYDCGEPTINDNKNDLQKCLKKEIVIDNDDSWSDLTDVSSLAVDDSSRNEEKDLKIEIFASNGNNPRDSKTENNYIPSKIKAGSVKSASAINNSQSEDQIKKCYEDEDLSFKIPKDTNYISEDWKNTIDALQLRLSEMMQQNNELKIVNQRLETQIENIVTKHKEETEQMVKMLEIHQSREMEKLKDIHSDNIFHMEKSCQDNIEKFEKEYQEKINKLIDSYTEKISEINKQQNDIIKKKDDEICKLTEVIQQQCTRITNDISNLHNQVSSCSCDKKLLLLKKCISKMDKLFQRSEKEYIRQIDRLQQELEIKNTALQIQLKMQKAELIAETSSERQEEFDKILNTLEVKYIKMLEMHENQIMEMKKQDDEKIQTLKELLSKHGIPYDDHDV